MTRRTSHETWNRRLPSLAFVTGLAVLAMGSNPVALLDSGSPKTSVNTVGVRAVQDSAGATAGVWLTRSDTTGWGRNLQYDSVAEWWKPNGDSLYPNSDFFMQPVTLYFIDDTATQDSLIAAQVLLNQARSIDNSVGSEAIVDYSIGATDADSGAAFIFGDIDIDAVEFRQVPSAGVALDFPYGVADASGKIISIEGSSNTGTGIDINNWPGIALRIDRKTGGTNTTASAIDISMAQEQDSSAMSYGIDVDYSGVGKVSGLQIEATSGTRNFDSYATRINVGTLHTIKNGNDAYGLYVDVDAIIQGSDSRNIGAHLEADTTNGGVALKTIGTAEFNGWQVWRDLSAPKMGTMTAGDTLLTVAYAGVDADSCLCWAQQIAPDNQAGLANYGLTVDDDQINLYQAVSADDLVYWIFCIRRGWN